MFRKITEGCRVQKEGIKHAIGIGSGKDSKFLRMFNCCSALSVSYEPSVSLFQPKKTAYI